MKIDNIDKKEIGNEMQELQQKNWQYAEVDAYLAGRLSDELHISPIVSQLLWQRGIREAEKGQLFLQVETANMHDPFLLKDMEIAVERILKAVKQKERIVVYGDYDVDGITATSLLYRFLKKIDANADYYIPERQSEGYGLNQEAVDFLAKQGVNLIITVDCGISSYDIVEQSSAYIDIIITDHHTPPSDVPPALAVINPKQVDCLYPDQMLAGAGVSFKLCQALWKRLTGELYIEDLDIVALGTIADVVPLIGENRILAKCGLEKMKEHPNLGLSALIKVAGLQDKDHITAGHVGFSLAPRLNSAGRVTHATRGVELLLTTDENEAEAIAQELQETNTERQQIERQINEEAHQAVIAQGELADKIIVVAGEGWHSGVIGIVASRLMEHFYRPTIMISLHDGIGKGSCRSIEGFDMYDALASCKDILLQFGGHKQAAGFSIDADNIDALRERLHDYCLKKMKVEDYIPKVYLDLELTPALVENELIDEISLLEPYGMSNPTPVFAMSDLVVRNIFILGYQKNHIKFILEKDGKMLEAIAWHGSHYQTFIFKGDVVKIAFTMQKNEWQGQVVPQLVIQDIQLNTQPTAVLTRESLREWYLFIKNLFKNQEKPKYLLEMEVLQQVEPEKRFEAMVAIEIFKELGVIEELSSEKGIQYHWCAVTNKLDLFTSLTYLKYSS